MPFTNRLVIVALLVALASRESQADFSIANPGPDGNNPVQIFYGPGIVAIGPNPAVHLADAAVGDQFTSVFKQDLAQYPGWKLAYGRGALHGVLSISTYKAQSGVDGMSNGGAIMHATYNTAAGDPAGLTFVQYYVSQDGDGTHIDPYPNEPGDTAPMYYTAQERSESGLNFSDEPYTPTPPPFVGYINDFFTYMCSFNSTTKVLTVYDGWEWGFNIGGTGFADAQAVPEPSSIAALVVGLALAALSGVRGRPSRVTDGDGRRGSGGGLIP